MDEEWVGSGLLGAPPPPRSLGELEAVAAEQRGLITRRQCLSAGMTESALTWRLDRGTWVRVHAGVYLTTPGRDDWWTGAVAAHLACGSRAAWSRDTAAYAFGLVRRTPRLVELIVPHDVVAPTLSGARVRRSRRLGQRVDPLRWPWRTTVEETLLDLAEDGSVDETFALIGCAFQKRLTWEQALLSRLAARRRHPRRALLNEVLSDVADGAESAMEVRFVRDVERAHGLPVGRRQLPSVAGGAERHDVAYDEVCLLVELDSRLGHEGREARVRDGRRDQRGATVGWLTERVFWADVAVAPCDLAAELAAIFRVRGWMGSPRPCRRRDCRLRARQ